MKAKLVRTLVDRLEPRESAYDVYDTALQGFAVRVNPGGSKSYIVRYRPKGGGRAVNPRTHTLGKHPQITPEQARDLAREVQAAVAAGKDPADQKETPQTVGTLLDAYLAYLEGRPSLRVVKGDVENHLRPAFGHLLPREVTPTRVRRFYNPLEEAGRERRASACLSALRTAFKRAGLDPPSLGTVTLTTWRQRERAASRDELVRQGHRVTVACNTAEPLEWQGVRLQGEFEEAELAAPFDLWLVQRQPNYLRFGGGARARFLWVHDQRGSLGSGEAHRYLFVSQWQAAHYRTLAPGLADRFAVLRNGIDLELIAEATAGVERDLFRIAYVSRPERGLEVLLNSVLPRLLAEEPRTRLSIASYAGGRASLDHYEAHLRSLAARYAEAVTWHMPLGKCDLYRLLGSAGAVIYPTPVPTKSGFAETSCIVAMEAMACGAAWISTDAGALPETVGAGGVLVPLGDGEHAAAPAVVDTMVAEALRVMRVPDHAERLRVAGRSRAAGLGWAPVAEQLVELARGTIARPRSVPAPAVVRTKGHIAIATPVYGQLMHSECTRSLLLTAARLRDDGYTMTWLTNSLASIQLARSHLTAMFLAIPEATHMMWVDADLSFPRDAISRLLAHDLPVVSGLYPFKRLPIEFPWTCATNEQGYTRRLASGVVEAAEIPGGFVLVKREVYLALMEAFPERWLPAAAQDDEHAKLTPWCYDFYPHLLEDGMVVPEDYAFCRLWRSIGGTVWADLSIRLTHHGWHGFAGDPMSLIAPAMPASEAA